MKSLQSLTSETVAALDQEEGVNGVIVLVARSSDDTMNVSMSTNGVSVDSMIAAIVQMLGKLRAQALAQAYTSTKTHINVTIN